MQALAPAIDVHEVVVDYTKDSKGRYWLLQVDSRQRDTGILLLLHPPPSSPFSRRFNRDEEGTSVKWQNSRRRLLTAAELSPAPAHPTTASGCIGPHGTPRPM